MATGKRVAIVGAGPAGALATDALVKEGAFDTIRVFERQNKIGGTWLYNDEHAHRIPSLRALIEHRADAPVSIPSSLPCQTAKEDVVSSPEFRYADSGCHKHLHSNVPPVIQASTQEPIPQVVSEHMKAQHGKDAPFRHREVMRDWVESIFINGNNMNLVELNTTLEKAEKVDSEWILTLRRSTPGDENDYWWQEKFDYLVVATGHFYLPYMPAIPGILDYDEKFPGRIMHAKHYPEISHFEGKRVVVVGGSVSAFDALHDIRGVTRGPVISSLRKPNPIYGWTPFKHPSIDIRSEISSFDSETGRINFADGSTADDVDLVLFGTGYEFSFPAIPDVKVKNGRIPGLYEHVFSIEDPSLVLIGMVYAGFGIRVFEWQAVAVARVLAGRAKLPSREEMRKWEADRVAKIGDNVSFLGLIPDFEVHYEALRDIAGDPQPGTEGRVLPKYDPAWGEAFWGMIKYRQGWWESEADKATKSVV
ncbi:putative dimethylaniline monooxygenase [Astrocystis sublimbata]|nr:putative dimethylaniline monooxygenase [Astrocystis sublimbata]